MLILDRVYGSVEVNEPVLLELLNSKPILRLARIYNAGVIVKVFPWKDFTRYEHSVGVMLFLKKIGASVEEQIAGLLHDVPHTAFSHAVDYVFPNEAQEYHEKFHEKIINESEIPAILKKYGFLVKNFLDERKYTLLEQRLPDLCADRVDYTLRELVARDGPSKKVEGYLNSLGVNEGKIVFLNKENAKAFAEDFLEMVQFWASPQSLAVTNLIADVLGEALKKGIITEQDFFLDDYAVLEKLNASKDGQILKKLALLSPKFKAVEDPVNYDYKAKEKLRYIDPLVIENGKRLRVSEAYPEYKKALEKHKQIMAQETHSRIIKE